MLSEESLWRGRIGACYALNSEDLLRCLLEPPTAPLRSVFGGFTGPGSFTPTPPPPWKLAPKCQTISAKGALRQTCLNH